MKIKKIKYIDSSILNDQTDDLAKPTYVVAVGFVVKETDEYIVLAREDMGGGELRGQVAIPKCSIQHD